MKNNYEIQLNEANTKHEEVIMNETKKQQLLEIYERNLMIK